jgi:hypothetical protein
MIIAYIENKAKFNFLLVVYFILLKKALFKAIIQFINRTSNN